MSVCSGSTVLITGCSRGLGFELARQYGSLGWRVIAGCRNPVAVTNLPSGASVCRLDLSDDSTMEQLAHELRGQSIDILIHNAGTTVKERSLDCVRYPNWENTLRVNSYALLKLAQVFHQHLARGRLRKLVLIGSQMGSLAAAEGGGRYAYRASKAAANMLVRILACELASDGIAVFSLHPGWVRTALGGPNARLDALDAARRLRVLIEQLTIADSGKFFDAPTGTELDW